MELDSARHEFRVCLVDVVHQQADVVNADGIQTQVKGLACDGFTSRRRHKKEQLRGPSYHRASAVILKYLAKTKPLVEVDAATEIRNADADIVDTQNHVSKHHSTSAK